MSPERSAYVAPTAAMMLVQTIVMMGVVAVPVIAPLLSTELGLRDGFAGAFQSVAFVGATFATIVGGTLVGRLGGIRVSQLCCLLAAFGLLLPMGAATTLVFLGAILAGCGYGSATPAASHVLARVCPPDIRGIVFSTKQSAVTLGGLFAGLLVPALAEHYDWRIALGVVAAAAMVSLFAIQPLRAGLDDDRRASAPFTFSAVLGNIALVLKHPSMRPIACTAFAYSSMQVALFALYVTILVGQAKVTLIEAGWLYAVMQGTGIVGRIAWGALSDGYFAARHLLAVIGIGAIMATLTMTQVTPAWSFSALVMLSVALGGTIVSWNGIYLAEVPRQVPLGQVSAATSGTVMFSFTGVVVGPIGFTFAVTQTGSYEAAVWAFNAVIVAAVTYLLWPRKSQARAH